MRSNQFKLGMVVCSLALLMIMAVSAHATTLNETFESYTVGAFAGQNADWDLSTGAGWEIVDIGNNKVLSHPGVVDNAIAYFMGEQMKGNFTFQGKIMFGEGGLPAYSGWVSGSQGPGYDIYWFRRFEFADGGAFHSAWGWLQGSMPAVTNYEWYYFRQVNLDGNVKIYITKDGVFTEDKVVISGALPGLNQGEDTAYTGLFATGEVFYDDLYDHAVDIVIPGNLTGKIILSDYTGKIALQPADIQVRNAGTSNIVKEAIITLADDGSYTVSTLAPGTYDVWAKAGTFLASTAANTVVSPGVTNTVADITLSGGDVDGDNEVTSTDLSILGLNLGMIGD